MDRMTLRDAAQRSGRSLSTLRRYIRAGRLKAEKQPGRFGPEYFISGQDLDTAGLTSAKAQASDSSTMPARVPTRTAVPAAPRAQSVVPAAHRAGAIDTVPVTLYRELRMKHDQLLLQYGMVRAGGVRLLELQAELEAQQREAAEVRSELETRIARLRQHGLDLERALREARLELADRDHQNTALQERVRGLERTDHDVLATDNIDEQCQQLINQARRVEAAKRQPRRAAYRSLPLPRGH